MLCKKYTAAIAALSFSALAFTQVSASTSSATDRPGAQGKGSAAAADSKGTAKGKAKGSSGAVTGSRAENPSDPLDPSAKKSQCEVLIGAHREKCLSELPSPGPSSGATSRQGERTPGKSESATSRTGVSPGQADKATDGTNQSQGARSGDAARPEHQDKK